jgi:hypothetical protein
MFGYIKKVGLVAMLLLSLVVGALAFSANATPSRTTGKIAMTSSTSDQMLSTRYASPHVGEVFKGVPHHPAKIYAMDWSWNGRSGYWCSGYTFRAGDGTKSVQVNGQLPGFSVANSAAAKKLVNASDSQVALVSGLSDIKKLHSIRAFSIWYLSKDKNLHADWKGYIVPQLKAKKEYTGLLKLIAWAKVYGPYKVTGSASAVLVGQSGSGTFKVVGSNGNPATLLKTSIAATNAVVTQASAKTNSNGVVAFSFRRTNIGAVTFKSTVSSPSHGSVMLTDASPGRQRLMSGSFTESASASVSFDKSPGAPAMVSSCSTDCKGIATVTWTKTVESGAAAMRYTYYVNGSSVATCDAAGGAVCKASAQITDGSFWTSYSYCYLNQVGGSCTTAVVTVATHVEIVCPAWVTWSIKCACGSVAVVTLTAPTGTRFYTGTVKWGSTVKTITLVNGSPTDVPLTGYTSGQEISVSFTAFRDSGHTQQLLAKPLFSGLKIN